MGNYNVFKLYVIKSEGIKYICEKINDKYIDIFFYEEIETIYNDDIKYLSNYYISEINKKLSKGEELILSKKELLKKFALLNSFEFYRNNLNRDIKEELTYQEDYLNAFKEFIQKRKDIAKQNVNKYIKKLNLK